MTLSPPPVGTADYDNSAPPAFYVTGGTLGATAPSYVERRADRDLLDGLTAGDYCYVLNSRQMGKSSLCVRTMLRLKDQGWRTCFLDLTKFGGRNLSAEQWYAALLSEAGRELGLRAEMLAFWKQNTDLGPMQRFFGALQQVALPADATPLTVFVDEIDVTRGLPFSADEFFAGVRQCYVGRATDGELNRLTVCLLGTATPADLIQDTRTSPFNIGRRIEVKDFTPEEAAPLAVGLGAGGAALLNRVLYWTGGHPYLTQRLCRAAQESNAATPADVDKLCAGLFLTRTAAEADDNLAFVRNRLLKSEVDLAGLLDLYGQMRRGRRVPDDEADPLCAVLKLSGVAKTEAGALHVRNRIYEHVFSREWIVEHTPGAELRRQREAYRRGLVRAIALFSIVILLMAFLTALALQNAHRAKSQAKIALTEEWRADDNAAQRAAALNEANRQKRIAQDKTQYAQHKAEFAKKQADIAKKQTGRAILAQLQTKLIAAQNKKLADERGVLLNDEIRLRKQALLSAGLARRSQSAEGRQRAQAEHLRYVSDMQLAAQAWQEGNASKTAALLDAHIPGRGANADHEDQRDFAWRYQWGLLHGGVNIVPGGLPTAGAWTAAGTLLTLDDGQRLRRWNDQGRPLGHALTRAGLADAQRCLVAPDGAVLAVRDPDGRLALLDAATLQTRSVLKRRSTPIRAWAFAPDGRDLVVIGEDGLVQVWDTVSSRLTHTISGFGRVSFISVTLAQGGDTFALANWPRFQGCTVYDAAQPTEAKAGRFALLGHIESVTKVAFSPDGQRLASADWGGNVIVYDLATRKPLPGFTQTIHSYISDLVFSRDGKTLAVGSRDGRVCLWDAARGVVQRTLPGHTSAVTFLAWRADGAVLAAGGRDGTVRLWETGPATESRALPVAVNDWNHSVLSPDGRLVAVICRDGRIALLDTRRRQVLMHLPAAPAYPSHLAFTPDGKTLAVGAMDAKVHLWDIGARRVRRTLGELQGPSGPRLDFGVSALAVSPDGHYLAAGIGLPENYTDRGDLGGAAQVWDLRTQRPLAALSDCAGPVSALAFSPDGRTLAEGGQDNRVRLWRVGAWTRPLKTFAGPDTEDQARVLSLAFSPDSRLLAVGGFEGNIGLYDARTGVLRRPLTGHTDAVRELSFTSRGRLLASASYDNTVKLWDVAAARDVRTLTDHTNHVMSAIFSPSGDALVTSGWDSTLRVWQAPPPSLFVTPSGAARPPKSLPQTWAASQATVPLSGSDLLNVLRERVRSIVRRPAEATPAQIDLSRLYNATLDVRWNSPSDGCDLSDLPQGLQTLAGTRWDVRGLIQLGGSELLSDGTRFPDSVRIPVRRRCRSLAFLHASTCGGAAGSHVGAYVIRYADGGSAEVPLVWGENTGESWRGVRVPGADTAWVGRRWWTEPGVPWLVLYKFTWRNPRPGVAVTGVDFQSTMTQTAPFLVAVTAE